MSYVQLMTLVALGVVLASPAFPQSPENYPSRAGSIRPITITTAGGRTYIVGVQRHVIEPVEILAPAPPKAPAVKEPAGRKSVP